MSEIDVDSLARNKIDRCLQNSECFKAQKVEFYQTCLFHPFHIELSNGHIGSGIAIHRHKFRQRSVADDNPGRVGRSVSIKPLKLHSHVKKPSDDWLLLTLFTYFGFCLYCLGKRNGIGGILRYELTEPVHLTIGHLQHAPDISQNSSGLKCSERDNLGNLIAPISFLHIAEDFFTSILTEINIKVGH